jgi:hypothetical protein
MPQPPLLPEEALNRVLRIARIDGMAVTIFSGVYALMSALAGFSIGAVLGLLAAGAGVIELHGATLLRHREPRGITWLVASQPLLLGIIWVYCVTRWFVMQSPPIPDDLQSLVAFSAQQWDMSVEEYIRFMNRITCVALAAVSAAYQGGMTIYYMRRRHAALRAIGEE